MRQAGVIAAAGVVALEHMVDRLADDHARARQLAEVLAERFPGSIDPAAVETNIVCAAAAALPDGVLDALAARGVLAGTIDVDTVRFVTHKDVDDDDLARGRGDRRDRPPRLSATPDRHDWSIPLRRPALRARLRFISYPRSVSADSQIPASALAVYAHPDDAEISAGGTLAKWADAGASVWVLVTARGDKGSDDPDADRDAVAARRVEETAKAAAQLGIAGHFHLGYDDGELPDDRELRGAIVRCVRELRPEVVLCPDPTAVFFGDGYFNHHDHRVTGWATLDAIAPAAGNPHYFPEHIGEGLAVHQVRAVYLSGTLEPNLWVDIGETLERKIDGLFCHASRLEDTGEWFREFLRERAEQGGAGTTMRYAEPFRRITLG